MGKLIFLWSFVLCMQPAAWAQDGCAPTDSRKARKLLDKARTSRGSLQDVRDLYRESLDADESCLECRYSLARIEYQIAVERNLDYSSALKHFNAVAAQCPSYKADAFYYAGIIAYGNQDYKAALNNFEEFLAFDKDSRAVSRDHQKKVDDIAVVLPEVRFYVDFYENPVVFEPKRLEGVCSPADEYLPMLSPDNEQIFFTRKEKIKNKGDIYSREVESFMVGKQVDGTHDYKNPEALPPPFNVGDNYGGVSISLDNREMFVTVCAQVTSSYKNCDLFVTEYERFTDANGDVKYRWSGLENLGPSVNTPDGWEAQPTLSADGNTLYFATVRETTTKDKDGNPTIDIYFSERVNGGEWTDAKPIGKPINTDGNDKSPFLHVDSKTMYFASNGRIGAGGYDIYYSRQNGDDSWTSPKNMGYPVNSPQDEHGLIVSTDGKRAYFASSNVESARGLDIFSFDVPRDAKPESVLLLKGDVKDENGEIIENSKVELKYTKTKEVKEFEVNKEEGTYAAVINLREDEDVVVSVKSDSQDIAFNSRVFTIADTANAVVDLDMEVGELEVGKSYTINDITFATNSSEIREASKRVLDEFSDYLKDNPGLAIEIGGHTDDIGDAKSNLVLSADRAFEVFGYLQESGVDPTRMKFKGYGETRPVVPNDSAENRKKNRRTEFTISKR
ncbi:MAG: OmpA family protein [Cryomorphaceae bacterium]